MTAPITDRPKRKPGPVPRFYGYHTTHVYLPDELVDWAKYQPGGFSSLVRRLLLAEKQRQEEGQR